MLGAIVVLKRPTNIEVLKCVDLVTKEAPLRLAAFYTFLFYTYAIPFSKWGRTSDTERMDSIWLVIRLSFTWILTGKRGKMNLPPDKGTNKLCRSSTRLEKAQVCDRYYGLAKYDLCYRRKRRLCYFTINCITPCRGFMKQTGCSSNLERWPYSFRLFDALFLTPRRRLTSGRN